MADGGDLIAELLVKYGAEEVSGQTGGQTTSLYDVIVRRKCRR